MWRWCVVNTASLKVEFAIFPLYFGVWAKEIVFVLLPEVFCGLNHAENAPDPAGGAHDAPPDPLVGWGGDTPPHTRPHSALWRVDARAFGASIVVPPDTKSWRRHWSPTLFNVKLRLCCSYTAAINQPIQGCPRIPSPNHPVYKSVRDQYSTNESPSIRSNPVPIYVPCSHTDTSW